MNVTEQGIRNYVEVFHATLDKLAGQFFNQEEAKRLIHKSLLPARIICYISLQFGIALEYVSWPDTVIIPLTGHDRVEDLLVRAPKPLQKVGPVLSIEGSNLIIKDLGLADAFPFRLLSDRASVTFINVGFTCANFGWERVIEYAEIYGDRSAERWSTEAAHNHAKDEALVELFIAKQAQKKNLDIHDYIKSYREKTVLVLGSYDSEGEKRLNKIKGELETLGYDPILIKDIPEIEHFDLSQKFRAIAPLCRFILIDDTTASGHLNEFEICRNNNFLTIVLRAAGQKATFMTVGASIYSNVILEKEYDPKNLQLALDQSANWAEDKLDEIKESLKPLYPWRTKT